MADNTALIPSGQSVKWNQTLDSYRRYLTDSPTPQSFAATLRTIDSGDIAALLELDQEMQSKDTHLQAVANTRRQALAALDWKIEPAEHAADQTLALEAAAYCSEQLRGIETWEETLGHLTGAIGPNVAVAELVWDMAELVRTVDVPGHRLTGDPFAGPGLFIETDSSSDNILVRPGKFIEYHPQRWAGFPYRVTRTHATVFPYLMIHFSRSDWMAFSELYGTPRRWAEYADSVSADTRSDVNDMLEEGSTDLSALLPAGVSLEHFQASGSGETYQNQLAWAEKKMSILYLGQTLTTDSGTHGSYAIARVHENVRADLLHSSCASYSIAGTWSPSAWIWSRCDSCSNSGCRWPSMRCTSASSSRNRTA
jgi:phage gp29-like protein